MLKRLWTLKTNKQTRALDNLSSHTRSHPSTKPVHARGRGEEALGTTRCLSQAVWPSVRRLEPTTQTSLSLRGSQSPKKLRKKRTKISKSSNSVSQATRYLALRTLNSKFTQKKARRSSFLWGIPSVTSCQPKTWTPLSTPKKPWRPSTSLMKWNPCSPWATRHSRQPCYWGAKSHQSSSLMTSTVF